MQPKIESIVADVLRITQAEPPPLLSEDSPTLRLDQAGTEFYLVGLIGGKDVGKSSLANALAGTTLCVPSHTGEGTRDAIAYAHESIADRVESLLDSIARGRHRIVRHSVQSLRKQVLVDLPDIDSKYEDHLQLTRSLLRHMLYPVWVQSVEKYADYSAQQLLAQVAQGNDASNFLFCLNKVDALVARDGPAAAQELADDFARRLGRTLSLPSPPRVFAIAAREPAEFDLPALHAHLTRARQAGEIETSLQRAQARRDQTLLAWIDSQDLPGKRQRTEGTLGQAQDLIAERLTEPLAARVLPRLLADPGLLMSIHDQASRLRLARWPIVNVIDACLWPVMAVIRRNLSPDGATTSSTVAGLLADLTPKLDARINAVFAELRTTDPSISELYAAGKLWDHAPAAAKVDDLTHRLREALDAREQAAGSTAGQGWGAISWPARLILTAGAVLWFPLIQPVLEIVLRPDWSWAGVTRETLWMVVQLLGASYLLKSVGFLAIYLLSLWAFLRFLTGRRAARVVRRIDDPTTGDPVASLYAQVDAWAEQLVEPIRTRHSELNSVIASVDQSRAA